MSQQDNPSEQKPTGANVEGPDAGSPDMEKIVHKAEKKADRNVADQAGKEQDRQLEEGIENSS